MLKKYIIKFILFMLLEFTKHTIARFLIPRDRQIRFVNRPQFMDRALGAMYMIDPCSDTFLAFIGGFQQLRMSFKRRLLYIDL
jgi:hypothetical protein